MTFECAKCKLHYEEEKVMQECFAWCSTHDSCNLAVARQSIEARGKP